MYRLTYGRLISFGNFENRKIEIDREFDDSIPTSASLRDLVDEVIKLHSQAAKEESHAIEHIARKEEWQMRLGDMQEQIQQLKEKKAQLEDATRGISARIQSMEQDVEGELKSQPS